MTNDPSHFQSVKFIFFDLDDTLCGYWDACKIGLRQTFDRLPISGKTTDDMVRIWANEFKKFAPTLKKTHWYPMYLKSGAPTRHELMRLVAGAAGIDDPALPQKLADTYAELRDANLVLFLDARATIESLKNRGYRMGLITNGPADVQRQEIATLHLAEQFDPILIEGELEVGKPESVVYERAMELTGCAPHELAMVGNSFGHDIIGAQRAGWKTVWIRRPSDVPPSADANAQPESMPLGSTEPDATVTDLSSLLGLFAGVNH